MSREFAPGLGFLGQRGIFGVESFFFSDLKSSKYWRLWLSPKVPFGATFGANSTIDPMNWYFRSKTHTGRGLFPVVFCQLLDLISYFWTKIFWTDFFFLDLMFPSQRRELLRSYVLVSTGLNGDMIKSESVRVFFCPKIPSPDMYRQDAGIFYTTH